MCPVDHVPQVCSFIHSNINSLPFFLDTLADMLTLSLARRHADRSVQVWLQKLKESPSTRRLNLIYLSNGKPSSLSDSILWEGEKFALGSYVIHKI